MFRTALRAGVVLLLALGCLAAGRAAVSAAPAALAARAATTAAVAVPRPDHVVIVVEENKAESGIIGNADAPFITSLAAQNANFTQSYAETHPSQPNYLALFSGSTQGLTDDSCPHTYSSASLGSEAISAGLGFAGYSEDLPAAGYTGCGSGEYARKHNPWVNFPAIPAASNQPFSAFPTDYSTLPQISFVIPDLLHDMHDGTIAQGDTWLQDNLAGYISWAKTHNSLFVLSFDEDDGGSANRIPTILAGQRVAAGSYAEQITHYSVLRTLTDAFGLAAPANAAAASPITDVWSAPGDQAPTARFTSSCAQATCSFDASSSTDPDGTITGYAWRFGDGASANGARPTHTYGTAGSFTVTLTVTDDDAATGSVSHPVNATISAATPFVSDAFGRTVASGWGSADVGGTYAVTGSPANLSVSPGAGAMHLPKPGVTDRVDLSTTRRSDTDLTLSMGLDKLPLGGPVYTDVVGREVGNGNEYDARVTLGLGGQVNVWLVRHLGGVETSVSPETVAKGVTFRAGTQLDIRLQVTGTNPTTLRTRVWPATAAEPTTWNATATDSTAALQATGSVGLSAYLSSKATDSPLVLSVPSVRAAPTAPAAVQPPVAAFTSSCAGLTCTFDASASKDGDGGQVTAYAWDFGDGASGTGAHPAHTYSAAGAHAVRLSVTGNGGTAAITHTVTTTAGPFASDRFDRTVAGGWGNADVGGAWTLDGSASDFSVAGGTGALRLAAGSSLAAYLSAATSTGVDLTTSLGLDKMPVVGPVYPDVIARRVGTSEYDVRLLVMPTGQVNLWLVKEVGATETSLTPEAVLSGVTYAAGTRLAIRVQASTRAGTTTLHARAWPAAGPEPSSWNATAADSTASLQAAGSVGLRVYLSSRATNAPVTATLGPLVASSI